MLGNLWTSSKSTSKKLGLSEIELSNMRENGIFKPGIHWKSSPYGQMKPWNPEAVYNVALCIKIINSNKYSKLENAA
tara:strand:+ start:27071 stop:27301 length:231 start_codon:yes stop_codon:yes gene_type:complete